MNFQMFGNTFLTYNFYFAFGEGTKVTTDSMMDKATAIYLV